MSQLVSHIDGSPILRAVAEARERVLPEAAARVARMARLLIRARGRASRPGEPPTDRRGTLRQGIQSGWDAATESAVAGPVATRPSFPQGDGRPLSHPTVPAVLEHGGRISIRQVLLRGQWRNDNNALRRRVPQLPRQSRVVEILPRPSMRPALEREAPRFPELFRDSLRGGGT